MARKTKAQFNVEHEADRALQEAKDREDYPGLLFSTLEAASNTRVFDLYVTQGVFLLDAKYEDLAFRISPSYSSEGMDKLVAVWQYVNNFNAEIAEANRKEQLRQTALDKLSVEERDVLGL